MLYRQIDFNKGSVNDNFGAVPTVTGATFSDKEKGKALETSLSKYLTYPTQLLPAGAFSVVVWAKLKSTHVVATDGACSISNTTFGTRGVNISYIGSSGSPILFMNTGTTNYRIFNYTPDKNWHCYVFTIPGAAQADINSSQMFVDSVLQANSSTVATGAQDARSGFVYVGGGNNAGGGCLISKIKVYDTVLTQNEIDREQAEFNAAKPILKPKRNLIYPKPTDLSREVNKSVGSQLIVNSEFTTDVSGWTGADLTWQSGGYGRISKVGNYSSINQTILIIGKKYKCTYRYKSDGTATFSIGSGFGGSQYSGILSASATFVTGVFEFTATATTIYLSKYSSNGVYVDIDYFTVQELTGLIAAYNMKSTGTTLVDISGNGNTGTLVRGVSSTRDGIYFNGTSGYITCPSSNTGTHSILCRLTMYSATASQQIFGRGTGDTVFSTSTANSFGYRVETVTGGIKTATTPYNVFTVGVSSTVAALYDGALISIYINGVFSASYPQSGTVYDTGNLIFGSYAGTTAFANCEITDYKEYNRILSLQEIKDYHNSFAKQVVLSEDFNDSGADGAVKVPREWEAGTGSYKVAEFKKVEGNKITGGGTFSTDESSYWTPTNGTFTYDNSNKWGVFTTTTGNATTRIYQSVPSAEIGKLYRFSAQIKSPNVNSRSIIKLATTSGGMEDIRKIVNNPTLSTSFQEYVFEFQGTGNMAVYFAASTGSSLGDEYHIKNISIVEINPLPTITNGTKYLENTVAGTIAIPSNTAYGTWEWDWYKGGESNMFMVNPLSSGLTAFLYQLYVYSTEQIYFERIGGGNRFNTNSAYVQNYTWYRIKLTRTTAGVFTLFIKGGSFTPTAGYDGWTLVSTTGGTGTNPTAADNTYTTSNYFVLDLDAGDRFTNLVIKKGIII